MDTKIKKMRERLGKHRLKIAELEAQATEMEQEIKKAEEEQLGYLARFAANNLSGGIDEVFEMLRSLQMKSKSNEQSAINASAAKFTNMANPKAESTAASNATGSNTATPYNNKNHDENKEGESDYDGNEIEATNETE